MRAGDDVVRAVLLHQIADAIAAEIELDGRTELRARSLAGDQFGRVQERDEQRFFAGDRIAKSDEKRAVRSRTEAFDVERALIFGSQLRGGMQSELFQLRIEGEIAQEAGVEFAGQF